MTVTAESAEYFLCMRGASTMEDEELNIHDLVSTIKSREKMRNFWNISFVPFMY